MGPVQAGVGAAVRAATARLLGMLLQLLLIAASLRFTVVLLNTVKMRESLHFQSVRNLRWNGPKLAMSGSIILTTL